MTASQLLSPDIWPTLLSAVLLVALGLFSWRRRAMPGARQFAVACLFAVLWLAGAAAEAATAGVPAKIMWVKFQALWQLPAVTAITCFALEYANPGHWLNRRVVMLLSAPPLITAFIVVTNDLHHLMWRGFLYDGSVQQLRGMAGWVLIGYGLALGLVNIAVFAWLFVRSPQHRWPVALMLVGQIAGRGLFAIDIATEGSAVRPVPFIAALAVPFGFYAIALFGFRIFDPLPAARRMVIEQMREGMAVLDAGWQILSLNPLAESVLGVSAGRARGRTWQEVWPFLPDPGTCLASSPCPIDVSMGTGAEVRHYALELTPLRDFRGPISGYLLLARDVTQERQAQEQTLARQWAEATLQEREQLAHELHDGLSQDLAFLNLQAQTAQLYLQGGKPDEARGSLLRLSEASRELQGDVRELIGNLLTVSLPSEGFGETLRQVLLRFEQQNGLAVQLQLDPVADASYDPSVLAPAVGVQLLRIVQEALANVRKHAGYPSQVTVRLDTVDGQLRLAIKDDGAGFDPSLSGITGKHFGLQVMRQRAARIDGRLTVESEPGQGTRIEVWVPLQRDRRLA